MTREDKWSVRATSAMTTSTYHPAHRRRRRRRRRRRCRRLVVVVIITDSSSRMTLNDDTSLLHTPDTAVSCQHWPQSQSTLTWGGADEGSSVGGLSVASWWPAVANLTAANQQRSTQSLMFNIFYVNQKITLVCDKTHCTDQQCRQHHTHTRTHTRLNFSNTAWILPASNSRRFNSWKASPVHVGV